MSNRIYNFRDSNIFDRANSFVRRPLSYINNRMLPEVTIKQLEVLDCLQRDGFVVLNSYIKPDLLQIINKQHQLTLDSLEFSTPCLAQSKINVYDHKHLIDNYFFASTSDLSLSGLTFSRGECIDYSQVVEEFRPSTLTTFMLQRSVEFQNIWLDPFLLTVIANYMRAVPLMHEAYVRRNFPASYKTMNHFWHRDLNHRHYLLKVFFFLNDCNEFNGPHEYIKGSHTNFSYLNGKRYFEDDEVDKCIPVGDPARVISSVPAGTVVIEDTRGVHRAQVPLTGYRDLGYAVFMPTPSRKPLYKIPISDYKGLLPFQQAFIPFNNIMN